MTIEKKVTGERSGIELDAFSAAIIAEGQWELAGVEPSREAFLDANQYLVDTGLAWSLQGFFGRQAAALLDAGEIDLPSGANPNQEAA